MWKEKGKKRKSRQFRIMGDMCAFFRSREIHISSPGFSPSFVGSEYHRFSCVWLFSSPTPEWRRWRRGFSLSFFFFSVFFGALLAFCLPVGYRVKVGLGNDFLMARGRRLVSSSLPSSSSSSSGLLPPQPQPSARLTFFFFFFFFSFFFLSLQLVRAMAWRSRPTSSDRRVKP